MHICVCVYISKTNKTALHRLQFNFKKMPTGFTVKYVVETHQIKRHRNTSPMTEHICQPFQIRIMDIFLHTLVIFSLQSES